MVLLDGNDMKKLYEMTDGSILLICRQGLFSPVDKDAEPRTLAEAEKLEWKRYEWSFKSELK